MNKRINEDATAVVARFNRMRKKSTFDAQPLKGLFERRDGIAKATP